MAMVWYGTRAINAVRSTAMQALSDEANNILLESIDETPIDTGALRESGKVTQDEKELKVYISFGNDIVDYAIIQHETPYFKHPRGGKWKYLEDPFKRNASQAQANIKQRILEALSKG